MKTIILLSVIVSSSLSFAKVTDFNSLIIENSSAQSELHSQIQASVADAKLAVREAAIAGGKTISVASETVHVKTKADFLKFGKEKKYYKASDDKNEKRLAEEIQSLE